jgi:anaerobic selenocysteine-containing dehydrogenase
MTFIKTTCPRDCYDRCGLVVQVDDGRIKRVTGDRNHPHTRGSICVKCATAYNGIWRDEAARVSSPMRRAGPKGSNQFIPISWDEALADIAGQIHRTVSSVGAQAVLHAHYQGTYSAIACNFPNRFFHRLGATEVDPSTICDKAGHVALQALYGTSFVGFDPRAVHDAKALFIWGINPSHSGPMTDRFWLSEFKGVKVVVDPLKTATARRADLHLQPFPGTDVALVYGMLKVIQRDGLIDQRFVEAHVRGWAAVEAQLNGMTVALASEITGVAVADIEKAARLFAQDNSLLWMGIGLQRQFRGGDITRAVAMLPALVGHIGKRGCGFLYMNGYESVGVPLERLTMPDLGAGAPPSVSHMNLASHLENPALSRMFFNWNTNVLASAPNQNRLREALTRDDLFVVVIDLFQTDTARHADIVLPAANCFEFDDLVFSYFQKTVSAQVKVREPVGLALPNQEIFRRLARAVGFEETALFEPDDELIASLLKYVRPNLSFAELRQCGTAFATQEPLVQFADLRFATPSGRIEIDSQVFSRAGLGLAPEWRGFARPAGGSLQLLTPSHEFLMNSTYGNDPRLVKRIGPAAILMNAADAADRGLQAGDEVEVRQGETALRLSLEISPVSPPGVAVCYKSRWPSGDSTQRNVNVLNPGLRADLGEGTAVNSLQVRVRLADNA